MKVILIIKKLIAIFLFHTGILGLIRWFRLHILKKPAVIILCYHRITDESSLLSPQCVSPEEFNKQVAYYFANYDIWPLPKVEKYLEEKVILHLDAIVLTFDDGYIDNFTHALPILKKFNVPATFYIASNPMIKRIPYWIDEMSSHLEALTPQTRLDSCPDDNLKYLLHQFVKIPGEGKKRAAVAVFKHVKRMSKAEREVVILYMARLSRGEAVENKVINIEQALQMQRDGHEIGAHSRSHPSLSSLDESECRIEIAGSIEDLNGHGLNVHSFAYPFGELADVGIVAPNILYSTKCRLGLTLEERKVSQKDNPFLLPRKAISMQSLSQIAIKLETLAWGHRI